MAHILPKMIQREVTIYDIARELKLSSATVSRALSDHPAVKQATKKKIVTKAREMGYRTNAFASNLRKQKTHTIGVLMHELHSYFMVSVLAGIEKIAAAENYDILIGHSAESGAKEVANVENLFHKRVDGLIASLAFDTPDLSHFDCFLQKNIPVVFFDRVEESSAGTKIIIDNFKAGYTATRHLIEQGCKRIVHITGSNTRNVYALRYEGYRKALEDHGIPFNDEFVFTTDMDRDDAVNVSKRIAEMNPRPDGLFAAGDFTAAVCMQTLKQLGFRIPEDIAVIGFNNDEISTLMEPRLSTINYPGVEVGEVAARNLINHLKGVSSLSATSSIILKSDLLIRESSLRNRS